MVPQGHLVLLLGLVEVTIEHLQDGVLSIDLTIVILLVNLDSLLERFSFRESKPFAPLRQDLHAIEMREALLLNHLGFQVVTSHAHHLLLLFQVFVRLFLVADADELAPGLSTHHLALHKFSKLHHFAVGFTSRSNSQSETLCVCQRPI